MASTVIHADLVLFLCGWFRTMLATRTEDYCQDVRVADAEAGPEVEPFPERQLIIQLDTQLSTGLVTDQVDVRMNILAGTKRLQQDSVDLALMVRALSGQLPSKDPGNPVAAVLETRGPFAAEDEQDVARRFVILTLSVAGTAFI